MLFSCIYAKNVVLLHPISSRDGGIGRHEGLKILWPVMAVRVQVPLAVLKGKTQKHTSLLECVFGFLLLQVVRKDLRRKSRSRYQIKIICAYACVCAFFFVPLRPNWQKRNLCITL